MIVYNELAYNENPPLTNEVSKPGRINSIRYKRKSLKYNKVFAKYGQEFIVFMFSLIMHNK